MRSFLLLAALFVLLSAGLAGGWVAMNAFYPSDPGTPAHAGAISQGRPEECTNLAVNVKPRSESRRTVLLEEGDLLLPDRYPRSTERQPKRELITGESGRVTDIASPAQVTNHRKVDQGPLAHRFGLPGNGCGRLRS